MFLDFRNVVPDMQGCREDGGGEGGERGNRKIRPVWSEERQVV